MQFIAKSAGNLVYIPHPLNIPAVANVCHLDGHIFNGAWVVL
jgi:hypothetical protein